MIFEASQNRKTRDTDLKGSGGSCGGYLKSSSDFFFSTRATWELCERGSLTTEVLSRHCRYIDGFETACEASYPEIKKKN